MCADGAELRCGERHDIDRIRRRLCDPTHSRGGYGRNADASQRAVWRRLAAVRGFGRRSGFTATMQPILSQYTDGMVVQFRPNRNCTGAPSLNVDTLGLKSLVEADGLAPMTCDAGQQYPIRYDAASGLWRKQSSAVKSGEYTLASGAESRLLAASADGMTFTGRHAAYTAAIHGRHGDSIRRTSTAQARRRSTSMGSAQRR
jgi:hypothetical protein